MRRTSARESPPVFSSSASARTSATTASATTAAAGTAVTSERCTTALAGSPLARSTVSSALTRVDSGFIAARRRSGSPVDMPPSMPPERPVRRTGPRGPGTISSCAAEPGRAAPAKPSPTSTPLIACTLMSAAARRASSLRSQCTCEPSPMGAPSANTTNVPPSVSPASLAASTAVRIASDVAGSGQRSASSSAAAARRASASSFRVARPTSTDTSPTEVTKLPNRTPNSCSSERASAPAAVRAAVSRALARSRTTRKSRCPYFHRPARSA